MKLALSDNDFMDINVELNEVCVIYSSTNDSRYLGYKDTISISIYIFSYVEPVILMPSPTLSV